MYYMKKPTIMFRKYESFGYITDNRNFSYITTEDVESIIGDKILSNTGAIFYSILSDIPQGIDELTKQICGYFPDINCGLIRRDAVDFYELLIEDGFIVSGLTADECNDQITPFSYNCPTSQFKSSTIPKLGGNVTKSSQQFFDEYYQGKPKLSSIHVEITSRCNERCIHCYIPHENKICDIGNDVFYEILHQAIEMKVLHITISGGEPMLHNSFVAFLHKIKEYQFSVNILSNLTLLSDTIINEMKNNPLLGVQTSLYSMNPSIHDEITQVKGSFNKTRNSIIKLVENNIPLQISCPIMRQNRNCYNDVKKWASEYRLNVSHDYVIIGKYDHSTQNLKCRLPFADVKELLKEVAENDDNYYEDMRKEVENKKSISPEDYICSVCESSICISENGNVYPCAGWQGYVVGNITNTSLSEIWESSDKVNYLRSLKIKDFPKCEQCPNISYCTMCMVRNANEDSMGNPLSVNEYFCNVSEFNRVMLQEHEKQKTIIKVLHSTNSSPTNPSSLE